MKRTNGQLMRMYCFWRRQTYGEYWPLYIDMDNWCKIHVASSFGFSAFCISVHLRDIGKETLLPFLKKIEKILNKFW